MHTIIQNVLDTAQKEALFSCGDVVFVALSGGADSVTLLHILLALQEPLGLSEIRALHLHHGLRGAFADRDEQFVQTLCADLQVPLTVSHVDTKHEADIAGESLEEAGRRLRYDFFDQAICGIPQAKIATAHTANDQAETVLFHLIRGSGMTGVTGIPIKRGAIVRPLIRCSAEDIRSFCHEQQLAYMVDETNADVSYSRNRIRHEILPRLKRINPQVICSIERFSDIIREEDAYLQAQAREILFQARLENDRYCTQDLLIVDPVLQKRALIEAVYTYAGYRPQYTHVQELLKALQCGGVVNLPNDVRVINNGEYLAFLKMSRKKITSTGVSVPVKFDQTLEWNGECYLATCLSQKEYRNLLKIHKNLFNFCISYDMISNEIYLRTRLPGDRFRPFGRGCSKSLKKFFMESEIPSEKRWEIPLLCNAQGVLAVLGYAVDESVAVTAQTKHILYLQKINEKDSGEFVDA